MSTGIALIETTNAALLFTPGGIEPILERIEREAREEAAKLDISTIANRKALNSLAFKVTKSKTFLEEKRKELVSDEKKRLALIDAQGKVSRERLDKLAEEIRQPLTEWENADKLRVAALEAKVAAMGALGSIPYGATAADIEQRIAELDAIDLSNMQEFTSRSELAASTVRKVLTAALAEAKRRDEEQAEMARLRAEAAAREQKERDERIAMEAREKAQREAEAERKRIEEEKYKAEARAKQQEAARIEAEAKAERDAKAAAERQAESERLAEERRVAAEARAKKDAEEAAERHAAALKASEERAERERLEAIEAERQRAAQEAKRVAAEEAAREKDKAHRTDIHSNAMLMLHNIPGITKELAKAVVIAIAKGDIPNVRIHY